MKMICPNCGRTFEAKRKSGIYCSTRCRMAAWRKGKPLSERGKKPAGKPLSERGKGGA